MGAIEDGGGRAQRNGSGGRSSRPHHRRMAATSGEPFLTPHTDEAVVFEDYFWRGLGFPVHPFLRDLLEFWAISLCNLHPNTILHVSVFIHFCEAFLGILPHFNLFRHLFCLKKKGGSGSKVVGGVYLQLRDGMTSEYINVSLNTSLKGWNARWFYIKQSHLVIRCDVHTSRRARVAGRRDQTMLTWTK